MRLFKSRYVGTMIIYGVADETKKITSRYVWIKEVSSQRTGLYKGRSTLRLALSLRLPMHP